jgi:hypothetical protein
MENTLFEDVFDVQKKDPDGKRFDKGGLHQGRHLGFVQRPAVARAFSLDLTATASFSQCLGTCSNRTFTSSRPLWTSTSTYSRSR